MILDAQQQLSDSQVATTNTTTVSTNSYDTDTPQRAIGDGEPLAVMIIPESIVGSADTYTFQLISATDAALTTSVKVIRRTRVLTDAEITAAKMIVLNIPPGEPTQRYIGVSTILGASDALTYSAYIMPLSMIEKRHDYPSALVIA